MSERICVKFSKKVGNGPPVNKKLLFKFRWRCRITVWIQGLFFSGFVTIGRYWKVVNGHSFILIRQMAALVRCVLAEVYTVPVLLVHYFSPSSSSAGAINHIFDVLNNPLSPVYTIQPVVKPVVKPVWQPGKCLYTRYNRLSYPLSSGCTTRFDNRLNEQLFIQHGCQTGCQTHLTTGLTTGWMFVYTIQPIVNPVVQPVWQPVLLTCKPGFRIW